ncbi:hypothetical protein [Nocardioides humi]|uniref:hypothetical protein n=1 Tax=Nocardioides humi TaxID=449461 RepID=UPI001FE94F99|nr:hypothetical protein [Nocardioides humi]
MRVRTETRKPVQKPMSLSQIQISTSRPMDGADWPTLAIPTTSGERRERPPRVSRTPSGTAMSTTSTEVSRVSWVCCQICEVTVDQRSWRSSVSSRSAVWRHQT